MAERMAVQVRDLVRRFGNFVAVDHLSFDIREGEVFGFLGPNGAGKSTTIRILCGLLLPTAGQAIVAGFDAARQSERLRRQIGYMPQLFSLYPDLTGQENLEFYAGLYGLPGTTMRQRIRQLAERLHIGPILGRLTRTLSTGWRQRVALACAIVHQPPVLFLDEPTSGVDAPTRQHFWDVISDLAAEGTTVLVTTHSMEEAERCHRLVMIDRGKLIALDTPAALRASLAGGLYQVQVEPLLAGLSALAEADFVLEASLSGTRVRVRVPEGLSDPAAQIRSMLQAVGATVGEISPAPATLEDVFVALVAESGGVA